MSQKSGRASPPTWQQKGYVCNEREFVALLAAAPSVAAKIRKAASERRDLKKAS